MIDLNTNKLIYVGDPMCSWCYGVAGELTQLKEKYELDFPFHVVVGGLRPYETAPLDARMKGVLRHHWEEVNARSGQPFNYELLEEETPFVYNTEKACRAVVTMRHLQPKTVFDFFKEVQVAFYANNIDTNQVESYLPIVAQFDVDIDEFVTLFHTEEIRKLTYEDFIWSQSVGVTGYPSSLLLYERTLYAIALGYDTFHHMDEIMHNILQKVHE